MNEPVLLSSALEKISYGPGCSHVTLDNGYLEFKVSLSSAVVLIVVAYMASASVVGEISAKQKSCHA